MKLQTLANLLLLSNWATNTHSFVTQQPILHASSSTDSLVELHKALVSHESISGNEKSSVEFLVKYLEKQNFTVERQEVTPGRDNILAYIGKERKTRIAVSSHTDTVPPFWPYERRGDEIWGRGTVDAKGSVAAQIKAVEELRDAGKVAEGDVSLLFTTGEEVSGDGMKKANELGLSWETVIFGEPTELKLASGHKGTMGLEITAKGKAGHSGYPELGRNAIASLIPALYALQNIDLPWSEKYGNTTLNIGRIEGGVAANVIAEDASALVGIRIADGSPDVVAKLCLEAIEKTGEELDVVVREGYGPIYIDSDVEGFDTIVVNYGTDIPNLKGDHKRYLYGPGSILVAHSDHEHLSIADLETAVKGYKTLIEHSLE